MTENVVTNGDTATTHPSTTANGSAEIEPHPSNNSNGDTATSEPHPSTLTNEINLSITSSTISDEKHTVSNEGHSDLAPMINGVPNEGPSDLTSMMNGRCSPLEKQKDTTTPVSTEESNPGKLHVIVTPRFLLHHSNTSYEGIYTSKTLVEVSYFLRKWSLFVSLRINNSFFDLSS